MKAKSQNQSILKTKHIHNSFLSMPIVLGIETKSIQSLKEVKYLPMKSKIASHLSHGKATVAALDIPGSF
jgi:hypothetical protein